MYLSIEVVFNICLWQNLLHPSPIDRHWRVQKSNKNALRLTGPSVHILQYSFYISFDSKVNWFSFGGQIEIRATFAIFAKAPAKPQTHIHTHTNTHHLCSRNATPVIYMNVFYFRFLFETEGKIAVCAQDMFIGFYAISTFVLAKNPSPFPLRPSCGSLLGTENAKHVIVNRDMSPADWV